MKSYRAWLVEILPTWLNGVVGEKFSGSLALVMGDTLGEIMRQALFARFLYWAEFPDDALRLIGSERMMPRYGNEKPQRYLERLKRAWPTWMFAGTRQAVLDQLASAGFVADLWENFQWNFDGDTDDWSRFWVVLREFPYAQWYLGDEGIFLGYGGLTLGSDMTLDEQANVRALIRQWKAGHVRCAHIIVPWDLEAWDANPPDGTWGDPANRPPYATFIPG